MTTNQQPARRSTPSRPAEDDTPTVTELINGLRHRKFAGGVYLSWANLSLYVTGLVMLYVGIRAGVNIVSWLAAFTIVAVGVTTLLLFRLSRSLFRIVNKGSTGVIVIATVIVTLLIQNVVLPLFSSTPSTSPSVIFITRTVIALALIVIGLSLFLTTRPLPSADADDRYDNHQNDQNNDQDPQTNPNYGNPPIAPQVPVHPASVDPRTTQQPAARTAPARVRPLPPSKRHSSSDDQARHTG